MIDKLPPKILILDNEDDLSLSLCNAMERNWLNVSKFTDYKAAVHYLNTREVHVVILSSRIENISAIEMAARIRKFEKCKNIPIVFLIDDSESKNNYRAVGTDLISIISRPIDSNQVIGDIKYLLRKSSANLADAKINYDDITMDLSTFQVFVSDKLVHLSPVEFTILKLLVSNPRKEYTRERFIKYIWGEDHPNKSLRTIDVHINRIRTLIKAITNTESRIKTIRSGGYYID